MKLDLYGTLCFVAVLAAAVLLGIFAPDQAFMGTLAVIANLLPSPLRRPVLPGAGLGDS